MSILLGIAGDFTSEGVPLDHYVTKIGGRPVLPGSKSPPESQQVACQACGAQLVPVVQVGHHACRQPAACCCAHPALRGLTCAAWYMAAGICTSWHNSTRAGAPAVWVCQPRVWPCTWIMARVQVPDTHTTTCSFSFNTACSACIKCCRSVSRTQQSNVSQTGWDRRCVLWGCRRVW